MQEENILDARSTSFKVFKIGVFITRISKLDYLPDLGKSCRRNNNKIVKRLKTLQVEKNKALKMSSNPFRTFSSKMFTVIFLSCKGTI